MCVCVVAYPLIIIIDDVTMPISCSLLGKAHVIFFVLGLRFTTFVMGKGLNSLGLKAANEDALASLLVLQLDTE